MLVCGPWRWWTRHKPPPCFPKSCNASGFCTHNCYIKDFLFDWVLMAQVSHLHYKMLESLNVLSLMSCDSFCLSSEVRNSPLQSRNKIYKVRVNEFNLLLYFLLALNSMTCYLATKFSSFPCSCLYFYLESEVRQHLTLEGSGEGECE